MSGTLSHIPMPGWWSTLPTTGWYVYRLYAIRPRAEDPTSRVCVYVGQTGYLRQRMARHSFGWWFQTLDPDACVFTKFATREEAEIEELRQIREHVPVLNVTGPTAGTIRARQALGA